MISKYISVNIKTKSNALMKKKAYTKAVEKNQ